MEWLALILGVLKFPGEVRALIKLLSKTPEEKHQDIMKSISDQAEKLAKEGRPTWDN